VILASVLDRSVMQYGHYALLSSRPLIRANPNTGSLQSSASNPIGTKKGHSLKREVAPRARAGRRCRKAMASAPVPVRPDQSTSLRDRGFESGSLQQRVRCEPASLSLARPTSPSHHVTAWAEKVDGAVVAIGVPAALLPCSIANLYC
jgi:hypothetical protein